MLNLFLTKEKGKREMEGDREQVDFLFNKNSKGTGIKINNLLCCK